MEYELKKLQQAMEYMYRDISWVNAQTLDEMAGEYSPAECAAVMAALRDLNEAADAVKKHIGRAYDWTRMSLVPSRMEAAGLEGMRVGGIGRVVLESDLSASMPDKQLGFAWLEENGHGDLVTETVNSSSLKATIRKMLRDGKEVPEDVFRVSLFTRAKIIKAQN